MKRKYFNFVLLTEENEEHALCFSPEKHKLVADIGCELKRLKRSQNGHRLYISEKHNANFYKKLK